MDVLNERQSLTSTALGLARAIISGPARPAAEEAAAAVRDIAAGVRADEDAKKRQLAAQLDDFARSLHGGKLGPKDRDALAALLRERDGAENELLRRFDILAAIRAAAEAAARKRAWWEAVKDAAESAELRLRNFDRERLELCNSLATGQSRKAAAAEARHHLVALVEANRELLGVTGAAPEIADQLLDGAAALDRPGEW